MPVGVYERKVRDPFERLCERVVVDLATGCWEWTGQKGPNGYGKIGVGQRSKGEKRTIYTHRLAFESVRGQIPEGMDLDHLCRNRGCCNPDHLEPVTRRENTRRGIGPALLGALNGSKTHCKHGHEFTPENTIIRRTGGRRCRTCERQRRSETEMRKSPKAPVWVAD